MANLKKLPQPLPANAYKFAVYGLSRSRYVQAIGVDDYGGQPFQWQMDILNSDHKRKVINGARQSGKSTIVSSIPCHRARFYPKSLSIIVASTERQAQEDMEKINDYIARDEFYPKIVRNSDSLIELANRSRIVVVPGTEKSARGYSSPDIIILDECSRIDDIVFQSGIMPMLTDNEKCELLLISTPNGKSGFFHNACQSETWERYEVRSPWDVSVDGWGLVEAIDEDKYRREREKRGITAYYSYRHRIFSEQMGNLDEMGRDMFKQEYCCEFVEPNEQVFSYDEIDAIFSRRVEPLSMSFGSAKPLDIAINY